MKTIMKTVVVLFVALLSGSAVQAAWISGDINQTMGNQNYQGTQASADIGGAFHVAPSFGEYRSDSTKGFTYKDYSLRAAYDQKSWGFGVSGGALPIVDGYRNYFFGADGVVSLLPDSKPALRAGSAASNPYYWGPSEAGLAGVDLRAGVKQTHNEEGTAFLGGGAPVRFDQTDLHGAVDAALMDNLVTVNFNKSLYNHNLGAIHAQNAEVTSLDGLTNVVLGFPETSVNARIQMQMIPLMTPYLSYTHTTFQLAVPASDGYAFGLAANLMMLSVNASYEHYVQHGATTLNFINVGAGLNF